MDFISLKVTPPPDGDKKKVTTEMNDRFLTPPKRQKIPKKSKITPLTPEEKTQELFRLAKNGNTYELRDLIAWGIDDINAANFKGYTALMWAAINGHIDVIDLLIQSKANIFLNNHRGHTALHCAVLKNREQAAFKLLVNMSTEQRAVLKKDDFFKDILTKFEKNKPKPKEFNVNAQNHKGETMFMLAARYGHVKTAEWLVSYGADVDMLDAQGKTARMQAEEYKKTFRDRCPQMIEDLRQRHTLIFSFKKPKPELDIPPSEQELVEGVKKIKIDSKNFS